MNDNKEAMKLLLEELMLKLMGQALDCTRMAIENDRQQKQIERTIRSATRALVSDGKKLIDSI